MKIVTVEEMRRIEERCAQQGVPMDTLMENAGLAVARKARERLEVVRRTSLLVLVGPGNNGGDGLVAARHLWEWGTDVTAYLALPRSKHDPKLKFLPDIGVSVVSAEDDASFEQLDDLLGRAHLVIDALLGTGRSRPIEGTLAGVLSRLAKARAERVKMKLVALDLPTGLNADTGEADPLCPTADVTVALGCPKVGHFAFPGADRVGRLEVVDIGIPPSLADDVPQELITPERVLDALPRRPRNAHKGTFGRVMVIAGSSRYIGAAYLACMGAARSGAGLVTLAAPGSLLPVFASKLTETTFLPLPEKDGALSPEASELVISEAHGYQALLAGCGLGQSPDTSAFLRQTLLTHRYSGPPMVLDADALNILSVVPEWWLQLRGEAVVTPHPGEMSRLTGTNPGQINSDRLNIARRFAAQWDKVVTLKGAYTAVGSPDGRVLVSPFANPGLASAGTGDVLAGAIAGLLAQGASPFDAAVCGVYLHGAAGERVRAEMGEAGMMAGDLLPQLPRAIKQLRE